MEQQQKQQQSLEAMSDSATKRDLSDALTILHDASQAGRTAIDEILTRKYAIPRRGSNDRRTLSSTHSCLPEYLDNLAASKAQHVDRDMVARTERILDLLEAVLIQASRSSAALRSASDSTDVSVASEIDPNALAYAFALIGQAAWQANKLTKSYKAKPFPQDLRTQRTTFGVEDLLSGKDQDASQGGASEADLDLLYWVKESLTDPRNISTLSHEPATFRRQLSHVASTRPFCRHPARLPASCRESLQQTAGRWRGGRRKWTSKASTR